MAFGHILGCYDWNLSSHACSNLCLLQNLMTALHVTTICARKALSKNNLYSKTNVGYLPHPAAVRGESMQTAWHTQTAEYYLLLPIYGSSPWCVPQGNLWRTDCVPLVCGPLLLHSWYHVPLVYTCKSCRFSWEREETLSTVISRLANTPL